MAKQVIGEIIEIVRADDRQLIDTLRKDEEIVRRSAGNMQGQLDRVTVSTEKSGMAAMASTQAFASLSATFSAAGGTAAVMAGRLSSLGGSLASLGRLALGPVGVLLALGAALSSWLELLDRHNTKLREAAEAQEAWNRRIRETGQALKQQAETLETTLIPMRAGKDPRSQAAAWREVELRNLAAQSDIAERTLRDLKRHGGLDEIYYQKRGKPTGRWQDTYEGAEQAGRRLSAAAQAAHEVLNKQIEQGLLIEAEYQHRITIIDQDAAKKRTDERIKAWRDSLQKMEEEWKGFHARLTDWSKQSPFMRIVSAMGAMGEEYRMKQGMERWLRVLGAILPSEYIEALRGKLGVGAAASMAVPGGPSFLTTQATPGIGMPYMGARTIVGGEPTEKLDKERNTTLRDILGALLWFKTKVGLGAP